MSIAEKLTIVAENQQKVYDAGYQKGVSETDGYGVGVADGQALFGIPNEVTGTNIVTCDYVNENEHNVEVKLSSGTVTDFSGVEVKRIGKNVVDFNKPYDISDKYYSWLVPKKESDFFTVSLIDKGNDYDISGLYLGITGSGVDHLEGVKWIIENGKINLTEVCSSILPNYDIKYISTYGNDKADVIKKLLNRFDIQVEIGECATEYEPYAEKTYTANADGTVDGITSISSAMNIICDTEGVDITAKYYQCPSAEYDRFWDNLQTYGTYHFSRGYSFMGEQWTNETFRPKYPIKNTYANCLFEYSNIEGDLREIVDIDFSKCVNFYFTFAYSKFSAIGVVDARDANSLASTFLGSTIETIERLILKDDGSQALGNVFNQMELLKNITVEGVIGKSVNFQWSSLLSDASVQNIIDCLADLTGQASQTITFHADIKAKLTDEQIATITSKNWTLA